MNKLGKGKKIITITGASGSGKDSIANIAMPILGIKEIMSTTTRKPRKGEVDGVDYIFLEKSEADPKLFAEYVEYAGNSYGLTKKEIESKLSEADFAFCIVEIEGVKQLTSLYGEDSIISIYIELPGETDEEKLSLMRKRMELRGDTEENINKRINNAINIDELSHHKYCRHIITNNILEDAAKDLIDLINNNYISDKIAS